MAITFNTDYKHYLVFTHADLDGMMAAFLIKHCYDNCMFNDSWERNVDVKFYDYPSPPLQEFKDVVNSKIAEMNSQSLDNDLEIVMIDYAIQPVEDMLRFISWVKNKGIDFTWYDHHSTAIESVGDAIISGVQEKDARSATDIVYKALFPVSEQIPKIIELVSQFDSFSKEGPYDWNEDVLPFVMAMNSFNPQDINDNKSNLISILKELINENEEVLKEVSDVGKKIKGFLSRVNANKVKKAYISMLDGYKCLTLNSNEQGSLVFDEIDKDDLNEVDLLVIWNFDGDTYHYSIYAPTKNSFIDVGRLCKEKLNGGGHKSCGGGMFKEMILSKV